MSKAEPWIGSNIDGKRALRIEVRGRRDAERAGERRGEIGQDVGVQVGRDDGVERLRAAASCAWSWRRPASCPRSRREIRRATSAAISSHITMPWRCALDLVTTVRSLRGRDRASSKAKRMMRVDAGAREHRDVGRDLLRQAAMDAAADAGIFALGILAHDHPVELGPGDMAQRAGDARQDAGRPHIGVLIERLADREPQAPQRDVVGHVGRADRAEIDRVVVR